ncbi:hypothetical protein [Cryptosporangium arvum]|jgi:hypothetical protein|uniref:Uncharacterized protein n=1 Tax=Cryptosporangium arvum DSM 44712 TaxID=927661 RepID=A0A010YL43_9ACTN|nr:hypothetical protein [Cryptosporangium arvum]EXG80955.1 hypothetical protein CryarDRAFT_2050 [Cryptosporangium arvum DSM 44712]
MFARYSVLLLAALLAGPALWQAFVVGDLDMDTALIRYLIAVLVAAVMLGFLRMLYNTYQRIHEEHELERQLEEMRQAEAERRAAAEAAEAEGNGPTA